jgi:hypothetical protein
MLRVEGLLKIPNNYPTDASSIIEHNVAAGSI